MFPDLPNSVDARLRDAKAYFKAARVRHGHALWLSGLEKSSGEELTAFYFGPADEIFQLLGDHFFSSWRVERHEERVVVGRGRRLLGCTASQADIVLGNLKWPGYRSVSRDTFLHIPPNVVHKIPLATDWPAMEERLRQRRTTKDHLARVKKQQLSYRVTHDRAPIETFYDTMYMPHVFSRHADHVELEPREYLISVAEEGGLLQVMQGDQWISGSVMHRVGKSLQGLWMGVAPGLDSNGLRNATAGVYYLTMQHAIQQGCEELNLMLSPPLLNDGIFRFKAKLGSHVSNDWHFDRLVLRASRFTPAVVAALCRTPMALACADGALKGRALVDQPLGSPEDVLKIVRELACEGLRGMEVFCTQPIPDVVRQGDYSAVGGILHDLSSDPQPALTYSRS